MLVLPDYARDVNEVGRYVERDKEGNPLALAQSVECGRVRFWRLRSEHWATWALCQCEGFGRDRGETAELRGLSPVQTLTEESSEHVNQRRTQGVREERAHALRLVLVAVLVFCLGMVADMGVAHASVTGDVIYGPIQTEWQGETYTEVGVLAANQYDAAAYALGYGAGVVSGWSEEMRAKLSNESTGGKFYELAQSFEHPDPDGGVLPTPGGVTINPGFWSTAFTLYGRDNVWRAEYTKSLADGAKQDLQKILDGGNVGGGGGGGDDTRGVFRLEWTDSGVIIDNDYYIEIDGVKYYPNAQRWGSVDRPRTVRPVKFRFLNQDVFIYRNNRVILPKIA